MSGSSGGNSSFSTNRHSDNSDGLGNVQGGQGNNNYCQLINEITYVNSPKSGVKKLNIGDILEVKVESNNTIKLIKVYDKYGNLIGGISSIKSDEIIDCIEEGYIYVAEILDINIAKVKIKIMCQPQD
ncbi:hypothetical protein [Psychrobacter sp. Pi2-51]|uniref:hypothetical protein n=1 Tax=Psychrobacter sp. Pi2-51 TaxID=2774132 RepID=UPI0019192925|nr:hypothetical protein [Psychrobacter sp. Pi2-51]